METEVMTVHDEGTSPYGEGEMEYVCCYSIVMFVR